MLHTKMMEWNGLWLNVVVWVVGEYVSAHAIYHWKHITVMVIMSTKHEDTKFLMDAKYICGYVVVQCLCVKNGEQMML
jgi:hypothetical protein